MNKKGGRGTSRKQQYKGLCLAVNPPPFDKGGKGVGDFRGIIVFFAIVVRMAVFGATGGASKARVLAIFEE